MRAEKRKRLEVKRWRVGSSSEFLNLTEAEESYIELRLKRAQGLKAHRSRRRLTQVV